MGGNAIAKARRVSREEYDNVIKHIEGQKFLIREPETIHSMTVGKYRQVQGEIVKSYHRKEDFGDIDVVIEDVVDTVDLFAHYRPKKCAVNGQVMSISYDGIQVDFIRVPKEQIQTTLDYYAYNDLGGLIGKMARAIGFKYGSKGLIYQHREGNLVDDIVVTTNLTEILNIFGLDPERYALGFDKLDDIFRFISHSPLFHPHLYYPETTSGSGQEKKRDYNRKTYQQFVEWLRKRDVNQPVVDYSVRGAEVMTMYPHVSRAIQEIDAARLEEQQFRARFNGEVVSQLTGLTDESLGKFMGWFREMYPKHEMMALDTVELHELITSTHQFYLQKKRTTLNRRLGSNVLLKLTGLADEKLKAFEVWFSEQHSDEKLGGYDDFDLRGLVVASFMDYQRLNAQEGEKDGVQT